MKQIIEPLFVGMRKRKWNKRELVNAVLYLVKTGCQWRNLPHVFPPPFTIHSFYKCEDDLCKIMIQSDFLHDTKIGIYSAICAYLKYPIIKG